MSICFYIQSYVFFFISGAKQCFKFDLTYIEIEKTARKCDEKQFKKSIVDTIIRRFFSLHGEKIVQKNIRLFPFIQYACENLTELMKSYQKNYFSSFHNFLLFFIFFIFACGIRMLFRCSGLLSNVCNLNT